MRHLATEKAMILFEKLEASFRAKKVSQQRTSHSTCWSNRSCCQANLPQSMQHLSRINKIQTLQKIINSSLCVYANIRLYFAFEVKTRPKRLDLIQTTDVRKLGPEYKLAPVYVQITVSPPDRKKVPSSSSLVPWITLNPHLSLWSRGQNTNWHQSALIKRKYLLVLSRPAHPNWLIKSQKGLNRPICGLNL